MCITWLNTRNLCEKCIIINAKKYFREIYIHPVHLVLHLQGIAPGAGFYSYYIHQGNKSFYTFSKRWVQFRVGAIPCPAIHPLFRRNSSLYPTKHLVILLPAPLWHFTSTIFFSGAEMHFFGAITISNKFANLAS